MARMIEPRNKNSVARTAIGVLRTEYNILAEDYLKVVNGEKLLCPMCGEWKKVEDFYMDRRFATNCYPYCKECVKDQACDYDKETKRWHDNREKTIKVMQQLDLPFIETMYQRCLADADNESVSNRSTAFAGMVTQLKSLPQYRGKKWKDSSFIMAEEDSDESDDDTTLKISARTLKNARKRFGAGYTDEEYQFLEEDYQDWVTRNECNTKSQEELFIRLSVKKLELHKASLQGDATDKLDATYQQLLTTANITPRQAAANNIIDARTFGTLIQKFEETRPIPEVDPDLKDVDKIGLIVDVFFKGHLCKMFGLKNTFSSIYEKFMKRYTVEPPKYEEEEDSETIFNKIFGKYDGEDDS